MTSLPAKQAQIDHYKDKLKYEIDSWDLYVALEEGENIVVVDARSTEAYEREHIPGAVSFPHRTISAETTAKMSRDRLYITYCDGIGCNASTKSALKLCQLGFQVKEMLGGLDWWKRDGYATAGREAREGTPIRCGC